MAFRGVLGGCGEVFWDIKDVLESFFCQTRMHLGLRVDSCVQLRLGLCLFLFLW